MVPAYSTIPFRRTVSQLSSNRENVAPIVSENAVVPVRTTRLVASKVFFMDFLPKRCRLTNVSAPEPKVGHVVTPSSDVNITKERLLMPIESRQPQF
jgi:hypothetical protein